MPMNKSAKARYRRRKAAGQCVRCGDAAESGHVYCADHLADMRARVRELYAVRAAEDRCRVCGAPVETAGVRCDTCAERANARRRKRTGEGTP